MTSLGSLIIGVQALVSASVNAATMGIGFVLAVTLVGCLMLSVAVASALNAIKYAKQGEDQQ